MYFGTACEIRSRKSEICRDILEDLPDWFGIPEAVDNYARAVENLPMFGFVSGNTTVGFLSIKPHNRFTAEAYVLGVKRAWQRRGVGRQLFEGVESMLRKDGFLYLSVKTLAAEHPSTAYVATRRFYESIGFRPVEVFPTLWGPENPCLLMIKCLG